jgi:hypothetical protein
LRLPHFLDNQLKDGDEVVSLKQWPPHCPQEHSWYSFLLKAELTRAIEWLEGLGQLKNPLTSSQIDPATFRLAA